MEKHNESVYQDYYMLRDRMEKHNESAYQDYYMLRGLLHVTRQDGKAQRTSVPGLLHVTRQDGKAQRISLPAVLVDACWAPSDRRAGFSLLSPPECCRSSSELRSGCKMALSGALRLLPAGQETATSQSGGNVMVGAVAVICHTTFYPFC